jgi:hypothetical protein
VNSTLDFTGHLSATFAARRGDSFVQAENTGRGIRPVFSVHLIFLECTAADGGRSAVHLLGEIILQAQLLDQVELGFEEVDMFFLVFQENLEEIG